MAKKKKAAASRKSKPIRKKVLAIPENYRGATPYLCIKGAAGAIDFYKRAFGAKEVYRIEMPPGTVGHAELKVGAALFMLSDEFEQMGVKSPRAFGGSPVTMSLYVKDVDAFVTRAVGAGAKLLRPIEDHFYGDRSGKIEDPYGHLWMIATHKEDVSPKEMKKRAQAMFGAGAPA
jgi:PhnB protein